MRLVQSEVQNLDLECFIGNSAKIRISVCHVIIVGTHNLHGFYSYLLLTDIVGVIASVRYRSAVLTSMDFCS